MAPIRIFKRKKGVADCSDGQSCDTPATVSSGGGFSVKKRYKIGGDPIEKKPVDTKIPSSGTSQNVRDLGGTTGQPTYTKTDYDSMSEADKAARRRQEIKLTKRRKYFGK
jgi:hypothetical protein